MVGLQRPQLPDEGVVLGVGDLGVVEGVVALVVVLDEAPQLCRAGAGVGRCVGPRPWRQRRFRPTWLIPPSQPSRAPGCCGGCGWPCPSRSGPALADALDGAGDPVRTVASLGLWIGWAVGVAATLVPHPVSLTGAAGAGPGGGRAVSLCGGGGRDAVGAGGGVGAGDGGVGVHARDRGHVGERARLSQRAPLPAAGAGARCWPGRWCWRGGCWWRRWRRGPCCWPPGSGSRGALAVAVGAPLVWLLGRSLHTLSRRWAVFVPAGMVLHDPLTLLDPVLLPRSTVARMGPAGGRHRRPRPQPAGARPGPGDGAAGGDAVHPPGPGEAGGSGRGRPAGSSSPPPARAPSSTRPAAAGYPSPNGARCGPHRRGASPRLRRPTALAPTPRCPPGGRCQPARGSPPRTDPRQPRR